MKLQRRDRVSYPRCYYKYMRLDDAVVAVKGVGEVLAKAFMKLGIHSVRDLLEYLPYRYEDYSEVAHIKDIQPGAVSIKAELVQASGRYARRGLHITEAIFKDETDSVRVVWFNQPYRAKLKPGEEYFVSGQYELNYRRYQIMNPSAELVKDFPINTARIVPVYRQTKSVTTLQIRRAIAGCKDLIESLPETLPQWILEGYGLLPRSVAVMGMHYPKTNDQLEAAKRRLGFEEVLVLSLASLLNKQENAAEHAIAIPFNEKIAKDFVSKLPFKLTNDQRKTVWQIYRDMEFSYPMNRLVEGDVGSGKTVIAAMAAIMAVQEGYQVAFMAPTEILARQHFRTLRSVLGEKAGVRLLVGGMKTADKKEVYQEIASGTATFIIGTHALIQDKVDMKRLGLIIIDEQHRFGVEQRKELMRKAGHMPHVLSLTATPIPRSLALTLYGEMDISVLHEKPAGRLPIVTKLIDHGSRDALYTQLAEKIAAGAQAYVICPLVEESEVLAAKSAEKVHEELAKKYFKNCKVGLLHGRMKPEEKEDVMKAFAMNEISVLVATTVVEVGVDVPNASIMVVESAERFGLAQLHQLRGRVGRGDIQSHCYLLLSPETEPNRRLRAVESSNDGFRLAEYDLQLRGAGAIYGAALHGALDLRVAKLTDTQLIVEARKAAQEFLDRHENLLQYNEIEERVRQIQTVTHLN